MGKTKPSKMNHHVLLTNKMRAGMGVLRLTCSPLRKSGSRLSRAAPNSSREVMQMLPLAAPNVENDTNIGITTRPAFPKVAAPKGCRCDVSRTLQCRQSDISMYEKKIMCNLIEIGLLTNYLYNFIYVFQCFMQVFAQ